MGFKELAADFLYSLLSAFIVTTIVSYLYNLLVHDAGRVEWSTSFQMAIIFGIIIPLVHYRERKYRQKS